MTRRWHQTVALLLIFILIIGHSVGMQLIGWGSMLVSRTAEQGLPKAIASTFSGDQPCALCKMSKAIAAKEQGATDDGKQLPNPAGKSVKKPDFAHVELIKIPMLTTENTVVFASAVLAFLKMSPLAPEPPPPRTI